MFNLEGVERMTMNEPTRVWECGKCGRTVERYRGMDDIQCECGAWYNSFGQRLRDDWRGNPSNYDEDISDLEGFEIQHAGDDDPEWKKDLRGTIDLAGAPCTVCDCMDTLEYWVADNGDWRIVCNECGQIHDEGSA